VERELNELGSGVTTSRTEELVPFVERWHKVASDPKDVAAYSSQGVEVVEQMMIGAGWRVCASHSGVGTRSVLVRSADERGVKFVITAPAEKTTHGDEPHDHFERAHLG